MQRRTPFVRIQLAIMSAIAPVIVPACGTTSGADETSEGTGSTTSSADTTGPTTTTTAPTTSATGTGDSTGGTGDSTGGTGDESSTSGEVEIDLAGNCALADHVGGFFATYEVMYSAFSGSVADGVVPLNVLEQVGEDGSCTLLRRNNPFCDPGCNAGDVCDFDGNCIPYPLNQDVGTVTVTGLLKDVMLEPVPPTYSYFDTMLPHPGFEPGAIITVEATGGKYSAMQLHGIGVEMVVPADDDLHLDRDEALEVAWTPGDPRATMRLQIAVDQHGTSPLALVCSVPADEGSLTISGEIVTQFLDNGISGFPSADFHFETVDSVEIELGCVDFVVRSHDQLQVFIQGHTPCNVDPDCPDGQTCDVMNQTCV